MQALAARQLDILVSGFLQKFRNADDPKQVFYGPRRIAVSYNVWKETRLIHAVSLSESPRQRGPRIDAPPQALEGFLKKNNPTSDVLIKERLIEENGYYYLLDVVRSEPERLGDSAETKLPLILTKLPWPKSMRWGQSDDFTWVRPLRRITCLLDDEIIPIQLGPITASNEAEGHRVLAPGAFVVTSATEWSEKLRAHYVIADQDERRQRIVDDLAAKAADLGLRIAEDQGLLDEVTGLVEWPVALIGRIDDDFMDLPPEVRELSMKVNQKYFALRNADGTPASYFAFVANLAAPDGGAAIIAGNERVLRARLSDARHFWDHDLKTPLNELLPKLEKITFHAKIGTQAQRAERIAALAMDIAEKLGADAAEAEQARWAGLLCKADLVTGMVGEFPELQGLMGGYYAAHNTQGWDGAIVGPAIKSHYQPKGPSDAVPVGRVAVSVALADKLDTLIQFFAVNEKPTGSGDPYALRRAALGVIRIILENKIRLRLRPILGTTDGLFEFIIDRLRVKLRGEGERFDVLDAILAVNADDDLSRLMKRVDALGAMAVTQTGRDLHSAYKRAANIVAKEEERTTETFHQMFETSLFVQDEERALADEIIRVGMNTHIADGAKIAGLADNVTDMIAEERYPEAMAFLASLNPPINAFLDKVTVNAESPELRRNRLRLLSQFVDTVDDIADFSKIEG